MRPNSNGQTLVEAAMVLPVLGLGIFMALQLIWYCHNMVQLQRMAALAAERFSPGKSATTRGYSLFYSLEGRVLAPEIICQDRSAATWLTASGASTIKTKGTVLTATVSTTLFPGTGFSRLLPAVRQQAIAALPIDPPVPAEK